MKTIEAIFDLLERLGQISEESTVTDRLALQWINTARSELVASWLKENADAQLSNMADSYKCIAVTKTKSELYTGFFELPELPLQIEGDEGIVSITRPGGKCFDPIDGGLNGLKLQSKTQFGVGSNEYYYRVGKTVFINGVIPVDLKVDVVMIPQSGLNYDESTSYPAPDELMRSILEEAEKIGRRYLQTPKDIIDDGKGRDEEI